MERDHKIKIKEQENDYKSVHHHNVRVEKENVILKNELSNSIKYKNNIIKNFNNDIEDLNKLSQAFFENYLSTCEVDEIYEEIINYGEELNHK